MNTQSDTELRARAVTALGSIPATPTLVQIVVELLKALDSNTQPVEQIGKETVARRIAVNVAAHAGHTRCLRVMVENERLAALRIYAGAKTGHTPETLLVEGVSVNDVAEGVVANFLQKVAEKML